MDDDYSYFNFNYDDDNSLLNLIFFSDNLEITCLFMKRTNLIVSEKLSNPKDLLTSNFKENFRLLNIFVYTHEYFLSLRK